MCEKLIFKKAGLRIYKEIDSDELLNKGIEVEYYSEYLKLLKSKGRPKVLLHQWIFEEQCKSKNAELESITKWSKGAREEILEEYFGKEYIDSESEKKLFKEIGRKNITEYH